jgi:ABC-type Fe3+-hydroxamate transport system substrate-binding protein
VVKGLPKVGGVEPDVEKIVALHPDLVIGSASGIHPNLRRALAAVRIPLLVVRTERLNEIGPAMTAIGRVLGSETTAQSVTSFTRALQRQRRPRAKSPRVLFTVWTDPLYVAGHFTFADDLFALTGARNAVDATGWPQYSLESFAAHPPDLILYPNRSVTAGAMQALLRRARVKVEAVGVDENTFTRPGPRVVQAAVALNGILDQWERSH